MGLLSMKYSFAMIFLLAISSTSFAVPMKQSPEQRTEVLGILIDAKYVENIEAGMRIQMEKAMSENPSLPQKVVDDMKKAIDRKRILDELAACWGTVYTVQELREIRKFLKTPAGKKFLQHQPEVTERMTAVGAMVGMDMFQMLNKFDPVRYPMDEKTKAMVARYSAIRDGLR